jgi:hypothetical protein
VISTTSNALPALLDATNASVLLFHPVPLAELMFQPIITSFMEQLTAARLAQMVNMPMLPVSVVCFAQAHAKPAPARL